MIYIETHSTDPCYLFGLEYYYAAVQPLTDTVFLFWRTSPTVMVGKYQNAIEEVNRAYIEEHKIGVVRRMSGGGTVFTDEGGWQYSFIAPEDAGEIRFEKYTGPILRALETLGVNASFNGRNDLLIDGRKISGNAQYKLAGHTVHHGTLLFRTDASEIVAATHTDPQKIISHGIRSVRERVTTILEHLPQPITDEAFRDHMVSQILGEDGVRMPVDAQTQAAAQAIANERFRGYDNVWGASPRFSIVRTSRFAGGKVEWTLLVRRGIIAEAALSGDFFATEAVESLPSLLHGCRYERSAVLARLRGTEEAVSLYGVTVEEIAASVVD